MRAYAAIVATMNVLACSIRPGPHAASEGGRGYIVLDSVAGEAFSLRGGDTLPEVPGSAVPGAVRDSASAAAREAKFDPACTRFFQHATGFAALLVWKCTGDQGYNDGQALVFYTRTGSHVAEPTKGSAAPGYTTIVPSYRPPQPD